MIKIYATFGFLPEYYRCLYLLREETVKTAFYKEKGSKALSACEQKQTPPPSPFPIRSKKYHVDQSKNDMATWHLVVKKRGEVLGVTAVF